MSNRLSKPSWDSILEIKKELLPINFLNFLTFVPFSAKDSAKWFIPNFFPMEIDSLSLFVINGRSILRFTATPLLLPIFPPLITLAFN